MDRLFVCILVTVVCSLTLGAVIEKRDVEQNSTSICGQNPCPSFTVIKNLADGIEKRRYKAFSAPAYTTAACWEYLYSIPDGYYHVSLYTAGFNQENRRLPIGLPVLKEVKHVDDVEEECSWIFTTLLYVPDETLPTPKNPAVKIQEMPEQCFYVQPFAPHAHAQVVYVKARMKLNAMKLSYDPKKYFIADYLYPKYLPEVNREIWMPTDC